MTPPLLENELVKKYFGCRSVCTEAHFINVNYDEHERCMSARILNAMEEPIRKDERCLLLDGNGWREMPIAADISSKYHPEILRLPDRFQPPPEREPVFDPAFSEKMLDFKWCGYDQKEMRSMRDYAISHGWKPPSTAGCCCIGVSHDCPTCHKKPEAAKCCCDSLVGNSHCAIHKPIPAPSAVEAFVINHGYTICSSEELRELVALVRQEGK